MKNYIKLMRVRHYVKNLLVFAAIGCSGQFFNLKKLAVCAVGFVAFCLVSSLVYIINDIQDAEKDRLHPTKCKRPIAAGLISKKAATVFAVILLIIAGVCCYFVNNLMATALLALYLILNFAYSFGLKNIPILDIAILASGFLIRSVYGALITNITISNWLYLTVIVISFYFALGKRRNELKQHKTGETRAVLKAYPINFLDANMGMCLTLANTFYALWCMDEKTVSTYGGSRLIFSVPFVLLITIKYSLDVERDQNGDPVEVLLHDKLLLLLCVLYLAFMFINLYS